MYKIIAVWNDEVLAEKPTYDEAVIEAAEWAEEDDIMVQVNDPSGDMVYFVDGYENAVDFLYAD